METIREYILDNVWRVTFKPEYPDDEGGYYCTRISISSFNGDRLELNLEGQIKRDGCCDFGFNKPVMWHLCGGKDVTLLGLVFNDAMTIMGESQEPLEAITQA